MRKCKICEIGNVEGDYYICNYCGWEADPLQEENKDYIGGANKMSFNQYKKFCNDCKKELQLANNSLEAIKLSIEYYKNNFQKPNEEILQKEATDPFNKDKLIKKWVLLNSQKNT